MSLRYLSAKLAQQIDEELMSTTGAFSLDQLMELAGLACAQTLATVYKKETHSRVLVCCGPGNQGGDGLVAARHLGMFGYKPVVWLPKVRRMHVETTNPDRAVNQPGSKETYKRLQTQCINMKIPVLAPTQETDSLRDALARSDVVLDAIFGFSFKPPVRVPFDTALQLITASNVPIVSVDIPSGWDVENGNAEGVGLNPDVLVSLTAPKEGSREFQGRHFLGGRFVTKAMDEKFQLNLPHYPGFDQIVELPRKDEQTGKL